MTTYYVRADGSAATKAAAVGPPSSASACMSLAVLHAAMLTFAPGDLVLFSSQGGNYTAPTTRNSLTSVIHLECVGTAANRVRFENVAGEIPAIAAASASAAITYHAVTDYVSAYGFQVTASTASNIVTAGGGRAGLGYTNIAEHITVTGHAGVSVDDGDAFSINEASDLLLIRCKVKDVRQVTVNSASPQAYTAHNTGRLKAVDCSAHRVNSFGVHIGDSTMEFVRGTYDTALHTCFDNGATTGDLTVRDARIRNTTSNAQFLKGTVTAATSRILMYGCETFIRNAAQSVLRGTTLIEGGRIDISGTAVQFAANTNSLTLRRTTLIMGDVNSNLFITQSLGSIYLLGMRLICTAKATGDNLMNAAAGVTGVVDIIGCLITGANIQGGGFTIAGGIGRILHTTFYKICAAGNGNRAVDIVPGLGIQVENCIFHACLGTNGPIFASAYTGMTIGHNCYSGGTTDRRSTYGDTATSVTTDPAFNNLLEFKPGAAAVNAGGIDRGIVELYRGKRITPALGIPMGAVPNEPTGMRPLLRVSRPSIDSRRAA